MWLDINITYEVIPPISLVPTWHHAKLLQHYCLYSLRCTLHPHISACSEGYSGSGTELEGGGSERNKAQQVPSFKEPILWGGETLQIDHRVTGDQHHESGEHREWRGPGRACSIHVTAKTATTFLTCEGGLICYKCFHRQALFII